MAYCGERNKRTIYYANNNGMKEIKDSDGYYTGERKTSWGEIVKYRINVSEAKSRMDRLASSTYIEAYGLELGYNKLLTTSDKNHGIKDGAVLWIDTVPEIKEDGTTDTPFDYYVVEIKESLNNVSIAIKKVDVG